MSLGGLWIWSVEEVTMLVGFLDERIFLIFHGIGDSSERPEIGSLTNRSLSCVWHFLSHYIIFYSKNIPKAVYSYFLDILVYFTCWIKHQVV